jgi:hypothetical protein
MHDQHKLTLPHNLFIVQAQHNCARPP